MGWVIAGLFGLALMLSGLVLFTRTHSRYRRPADDTLIAELLDPRDLPVAPAPEAESSPAPQTGEEAEPSPAPQTGEEGDWLETQLAWIAAWSQRMNQQIASAGRRKPDREE